MSSGLFRFKLGVYPKQFSEYNNARWCGSGWKNGDTDIIGLANFIYNGFPVTSWFKNGKRDAEHFMLSQFIAVDIDHSDRNVHQFAEDEFFTKYGSLAHATKSHTPESPRSRLFFVLDEPVEDAKLYKKLIYGVSRLYPDYDPACVDSARWFWGNKGINVNDIVITDNRLPVETAKRIFKFYRDKEKNDPGKALQRNGVFKTDLAIPDLEKMGDALMKLDPYAIDYNEWLEVIAGLKFAYGDEAFNLAFAWSRAPGKEDLTEAKWNSLNRVGGKIATLGSVFYILDRFNIRVYEESEDL
jgi:hypothetical protein